MNEVSLVNEYWAEAARDSFYNSISVEDWSHARAVLKDMEGNRINTWNLRLELDKAMKNAQEFDATEKMIQDERDQEFDHDSRLTGFAD